MHKRELRFWLWLNLYISKRAQTSFKPRPDTTHITTSISVHQGVPIDATSYNQKVE